MALARSLLPQRQREAKRAARSRGTLDPEASAVQLDELPGEWQAKPRAFRTLSGAGPVSLLELLEDQLLVLGGDARAGIPDRDLYHAVGDLGRDVDHLPGGRELHRVRQQVEHDLTN